MDEVRKNNIFALTKPSFSDQPKVRIKYAQLQRRHVLKSGERAACNDCIELSLN